MPPPARADQARDLRNAAELRLRTETRQALDLWQAANNEVRAFNQQILPAAQSAVDAATRGFKMASSTSSTCSTPSAP